jgi:hypothetical protein
LHRDSAAPGFSGEHVDISYTADGANAVAAVRSGAELSAEIADMDVNAAIEGDEFAAENGLDHIVAGDDMARSLEEESEQIEFNRGELDFAIFAADGAGAFVEFDVTENDCFGDRGSRVGRREEAAAENSLNAGGELARIEGLHQVIVGADFQAMDTIDVVTASREHDHGEARPQPDLAERFKPFDFREHYIEDDQGKVAGDGAFQAFGAVMRDVNAKAFRLEIFAEEVAQLDIIVHNENAGKRGVRVFTFVQVHGMRAAAAREPGRACREQF